MAARSTSSRFANSRSRSSRSRARNISSRCSKAANSCLICSAQPSAAEIEDFCPTAIRAPFVTKHSYQSERNNTTTECKAADSSARQMTVFENATRRRQRVGTVRASSGDRCAMTRAECNDIVFSEPSIRKLVTQHNSRIEQRLSRIVVDVAALLFVEPVLFGLRHPGHLGFRYHRLNRNKRGRL
jgi:hypothetical protein